MHILKIFLSKTLLAYILMFKVMSTNRHISLLFRQCLCIKKKRILRKEFHNTLQQHHSEDRRKHRSVNKLFLCLRKEHGWNNFCFSLGLILENKGMRAV